MLEEKGRSRTGALRKSLEQHVWPNYGTGLRDETWTEFYGNLAGSQTIHAHYTPELQGWQFATVSCDR